MKEKFKYYFNKSNLWYHTKQVLLHLFEMIICPAIIFFIIVLNCNQKQLQIIQQAIDEKFYILLILLYISITLIGFILSRIIVVIYYLIGILLSTLWYKLFTNNKNK